MLLASRFSLLASRFSLLALTCLVLTFSCTEKEGFYSSESNELITGEFAEIIAVHAPLQELATKARVDSSLFNIELLNPKLRERVEEIEAKYSKSNDLDPSVVGYPVWGAIMGNEDLSIIPTIRPGLNISYEYIVVGPDDAGEQSIVYSNAIDGSEEIFELISTLTYPILTDESREAIFKGGSITLLDITDDDGVSARVLPWECTTLTFVQEYCLAVSSESTGQFLCCKCEIDVTRTVVCTGGGGSGGGSSDGNSGGGGGGSGGVGGSNGNTGNNPSVTNLASYLDSLRNEAPDQIINNVDCVQDPCLCEVINSFSENPDLFENLGNEVSQLLQEIFSIPNYQDITITTSNVSGVTMNSGDIATHVFGANGPTGFNFPINGVAYSVITFNSDYQLNCTQAHLAATLLHESMHAYIEVQREALYPVDFDRLYPIYSTAWTENDAHHFAMAETYIAELTQSLHNMFPGLTDEYLEALTWQGLERSPAYNRLLRMRPEGFEQRMEEINNIASCQGTPYSPQELNALGLVSCFGQ